MDRMDDLDFSKLLQDAEQLTAEIETSTDLPRVHRNLRQVLEAGQLLLSRTGKEDSLPNAETKASVFLGTRGVDITNMSKQLEPLYISSATTRPSFVDHVDDAGDTDLETFLKNERANMVCTLMESASKGLLEEIKQQAYNNIEQDWKEEKEKILASFQGNWDAFQLDRRNFGGGDTYMDSTSVLSKAELTYTHELDQYNTAIIQGHSKPVLLDKLEAVAKNSGDKNVQELWASVHDMFSGLNLPGEGHLPVIKRRSNPRLRKMLIYRGKHYLERSHFNKLRSEVWNNLGKGGNLGGVPSVIPIIKHYINFKGLASIIGLEIGAGDIGPVWVIVYLCLRSGKGQDAAQYLREVVGMNEFASILEEYSKSEGGVSGELSRDLETKLKMEYRRSLRNSTDPFKRIIYCILGACDIQDDHPEVACRLDDYLWLKLSQIREDCEVLHRSDSISYSAFQELISVKYGEAHFDAFKQPFTYFQALFLTGQFETAIEFLARVSTLRNHAVHIAIILNELTWLIVGDPKSAGLIPVPNDTNGLKSINFAHMIAQYARAYQGVNTKEALNYLFALRNMRDEHGTSLFSVCVSDLAVESRDFNLLFGIMNCDGCRSPGLLETMGLDIKPIVQYCATESENSGMLEDAVLLYDIIGNHETALKVLIGLISMNVTAKPLPNSARERVQDLAITVAERYQKQSPQIPTKSILATFYMLVDCMTFFDEFFSERYDSCLTIIERVKIIPLEQEDIDRCVANFQTYADEIRRCIPEIILSTIECLLLRYKKLKLARRGAFLSVDSENTDIHALSDIKQKSKALVTYCGMIPYFMSSDVYTKVMQIEVQMN